MPIKLNSYVLPDKVIQKMRYDLENTKKIGLEIGFNLCTKDTTEELQDEKHCSGSSCTLTGWKPGCESKGRQVGTFHTHPGSGSSPSMTDLIPAYRYGIMCIGGAKDNNITCLIRKDKEADIKTLRNIQADVQIYERPFKRKHHITTQKGYQTYLTKRREIAYIKEKLQERLFDAIEIK